MDKCATETWSQIKDKYWDREWDLDEMLTEGEQSHGRSATSTDD